MAGLLRAMFAFLLLAACSGAPAVADPATSPVPVGDGPTFTLSDMGTPGPLAFYGDQGSDELTFPVPRGLAPSALTARVEIPLKVRSGLITVSQKDRTVARVPLRVDDGVPIVLPLTGAAVDGNAVTVTVRTSLVPELGYCLDPTTPLRLVDGAVSFSGAEAPPTTIAEFLPPILRKLTIAIPPSPSRAESEAAIRLATAVTAHYGQQPTAIVVSSLGAAMPATAPFERQVAISQGPGTGVSLRPVAGGLPDLRISGPEGEVTNQARLLASDVSRLALSSRAVVGPIKDSPQLPGDVTTLANLGQPSVSAVALAPQVSLGIDQTRIGRPVTGVRVHLKGSYTPPPSGVSARLVALVGGENIDTWSVDEQGRIDRWVDIPDRLLQRYTTLAVSLNIAGNTGRCGEFQPLTLTIDGDSVVQSSAAAPPVPGGLQSLPQSLMPRALVGIGPDAFADTVRAAAVAVAMQRLSVLPFDTTVTTVADALSSRLPAIVISARGWDDPAVVLPVSANRASLDLTGVVGEGQPVTLTLEPTLRYATLQAFVDRGRSLLVASSNDATAQLDDLLRWMSADPRRFSKLDGVAVVSAPGQAPVVVGPQPQIPDPAVSAGPRPLWWVAAALCAAAVIGAVVALLRARRRRPTSGAGG